MKNIFFFIVASLMTSQAFASSGSWQKTTQEAALTPLYEKLGITGAWRVTLKGINDEDGRDCIVSLVGGYAIPYKSTDPHGQREAATRVKVGMTERHRNSASFRVRVRSNSYEIQAAEKRRGEVECNIFCTHGFASSSFKESLKLRNVTPQHVEHMEYSFQESNKISSWMGIIPLGSEKRGVNHEYKRSCSDLRIVEVQGPQ